MLSCYVTITDEQNCSGDFYQHTLQTSHLTTVCVTNDWSRRNILDVDYHRVPSTEIKIKAHSFLLPSCSTTLTGCRQRKLLSLHCVSVRLCVCVLSWLHKDGGGSGAEVTTGSVTVKSQSWMEPAVASLVSQLCGPLGHISVSTRGAARDFGPHENNFYWSPKTDSHLLTTGS